MDRKQFLTTLCCAPMAAAGAIPSVGENPTPPLTPCPEKEKFLQVWVQRLMSSLDANVDEATRAQVMHTCGKACYAGAHGATVARPKPGDLDRLLEAIGKFVGPENLRRDGDSIYFNYFSNPRGLKVADGYCLCPIIESAPKTISKTYCQCSVGYVKEMFQRTVPEPVHVELLESVRSGGKACRFLIRLSAA